MTEKNEYQGRNPYEAYDEAKALRPVPAIEKPIGGSDSDSSTIQGEIIYDEQSLGGLVNWNDTVRGKEWG